MKTFKDFDDAAHVVVPMDLETQAKGRVTRRARRQRVLAGGFASLLVLAMAGAAFGVTSGGTGSVNSTDQRERQELRENETTTSVDSSLDETEPIDGDDETDFHTTDASGNRIDDDGVDDIYDDDHSSSPSTSSPDDDNDDDGDDGSDDDNHTTTSDPEDHDDDSGSNSGSDSASS